MIMIVVLLAVGGTLLWFGRRCAGGDISLLQEYHRSRVAPEDVAPFGKRLALGFYVMGGAIWALAGFLAAALGAEGKMLLRLGGAVFVTGFAVGIVIVLAAVKKYNKGIF